MVLVFFYCPSSFPHHIEILTLVGLNTHYTLHDVILSKTILKIQVFIYYFRAQKNKQVELHIFGKRTKRQQYSFYSQINSSLVPTILSQL